MNTIAANHLLAIIQMPGPVEMGFILVALLLIFGPKKLPELARAIGDSVNAFKDTMTGAGRPREIERDDAPGANLDEGEEKKPEIGASASGESIKAAAVEAEVVDAADSKDDPKEAKATKD